MSVIGIAAGAKLPGKTMEDDVAQVAATGAQAARFSFPWERLEPRLGGGYDFDQADALVAACAKNSLKICAGVSGRPDGRLSDPALAAAWVKAQTELIRRYFGRIDWFEGPNELNHAGVTSRQFTDLICKPSYEAAKTIDPAVFVVTGGLGGAKNGPDPGTAADYVAGMYSAGIAGHFDALGFHPYCYAFGGPRASLATERGPWWNMRLAHRTMRANREGMKPIFATENGTPTGGPHAVTEEQAVVWLDEAIDNFFHHPWGGAYFHFTHIDTLNPTRGGDWMGLLHADGTPKQTWAAFRIRALAGT